MVVDRTGVTTRALLRRNISGDDIADVVARQVPNGRLGLQPWAPYVKLKDGSRVKLAVLERMSYDAAARQAGLVLDALRPGPESAA